MKKGCKPLQWIVKRRLHLLQHPNHSHKHSVSSDYVFLTIRGIPQQCKAMVRRCRHFLRNPIHQTSRRGGEGRGFKGCGGGRGWTSSATFENGGSWPAGGFAVTFLGYFCPILAIILVFFSNWRWHPTLRGSKFFLGLFIRLFIYLLPESFFF